MEMELKMKQTDKRTLREKESFFFLICSGAILINVWLVQKSTQQPHPHRHHHQIALSECGMKAKWPVTMASSERANGTNFRGLSTCCSKNIYIKNIRVKYGMRQESERESGGWMDGWKMGRT